MIAKSFSQTKETDCFRQNAVIVGGGPAGLATALMLAKRGWKNITVLEKRVAADYYEPDKSFNYLIDGRGQKLTDWLGLTARLAKISVPNTEFYLTVIKPDGSRKTFPVPMADSNRKTAYWLPRRAFLLLLYQEIEQNWSDQINVLFNTKCIGIDKTETDKLEVVAERENGNIIKFEPYLLIGCDGINSLVRQTLKRWDKSTADKFEMKHFPSPSSGLRYKVLTVPPKFLLDRNGEEQAVSDMAYAIRGAFKERQRRVSLGLLPIKNPDEPRSANIITRANHKIWELKNGKEIYEFLEQAFPQLPIQQIVSPEEAERFAQSEGGYFPAPQYCSGLHFLLGQEQTDKVIDSQSVTAGVVLLGDAVHCFPPDIGQGVNSALEDVYILEDALGRNNDNLSLALPLYESMRLEDVKALVRLAQIAFPWQYNQAPFRRWLWNINFFFRLVLNKLLPFVFKPLAFLLIQNHQLSYHEILTMAKRTTQTLWVLGLMLIGSLLMLELI